MHYRIMFDTQRKIWDPDKLSRIWQCQNVQLGNTYLSVDQRSYAVSQAENLMALRKSDRLLAIGKMK